MKKREEHKPWLFKEKNIVYYRYVDTDHSIYNNIFISQ